MKDLRFDKVGNLFLSRDKEIIKRHNKIKNRLSKFRHLRRAAETKEKYDYYDGVVSGLSIAELQIRKYIEKYVKFEEV